jgi:hypothetical protein
MDPAALSAAPDNAVLSSLAEYSPAARVIVTAAVVSAVIGAQAASGGGGGARTLAFTNARLLPCLVKASVERQIETLTLAVSRGGGASAAALRSSVVGLRAGGSASADGHGFPSIQDLFDQVSDGFHDVVSDLPRDAADDLKDSRLMTQIGMLFGFVYLGFLTVWFWATRVRQGDERA